MSLYWNVFNERLNTWQLFSDTVKLRTQSYEVGPYIKIFAFSKSTFIFENLLKHIYNHVGMGTQKTEHAKYLLDSH